MKKLIAILCLCCIIVTACSGCNPQETASTESNPMAARDSVAFSDLSESIERRGDYSMCAAVLYAPSGDDITWRTTMEYLDQALVTNLSVVAMDASGKFDLSGVDVVFVDASIARCDEQVFSKIVDYTEQGGYVLLPNVLCDLFPKDYLGIESTSTLESFPENIACTEVRGDLEALQTLISDFHSIYPNYSDAEALKAMDYGCSLRVSTAVPLITIGKDALYALNHYGTGAVLLTSPLLPNAFSRSSFSLAASEGQTSFSNTTASCNQLFLSEFVAYAAKQIYGLAIYRVFGAYGSPAMSWELHYEDITSIANNSIGQFEPICKENRQIPSISIVRNTYTWFEQAETLAYSMNAGSGSELSFALDRDESIYSSGTHIAVDSQWLQLNALQDCISYFDDAEAENYRLFPCVSDYDGDGIMDAFCGSADGNVYYFRGLGFVGADGRFCMEKQVILEGVSVPSFSAPALTDLNGDGHLDLIVGASDGCVYSFYGDGSLHFEPQGILFKADTAGQCLPSVGDLNGDQADDIAIGSNTGILDIYFGEKKGLMTAYSHHNMSDLSWMCAELTLGKWLSPDIVDLNRDGILDFALGTYDGYVALFIGDGTGKYQFDRYITAEDMNYKGNNNLKYGHYCTPIFYDLNGDGALDLLCGYEEYGMAYPIDSSYFPYRRELQEQIDSAVKNNYYIGLHFMTGNYYSADREEYEFARQIEAFERYGLTDRKGANQHTWRMSMFDEAQSLVTIWNAGVLWESGYAPSRSTYIAPQVAAENVIALPFYLMQGDERTLLIQNCSVLPYKDESWSDFSGKYGMPVLVYYHCDMIYKSDEGARDAAAKVKRFQDKFAYNFVKEDQLMYGIAAAYNLSVDVQVDKNGISIAPSTIQTDFPLYSKDAQEATGVRVEFTDRLRDTICTDAAVWNRVDRGLTLGLDRTVSLYAGYETDGNHVLRVNTPADISVSADGTVIAFKEAGMQQAVVHGIAKTSDAGWIAENLDGNTVFTAYGESPILHVDYEEMK